MTLDEAIRLKTELLIEGLTLTEEAMTTVGQGGMEKVFRVFEMTQSTHQGTGDRVWDVHERATEIIYKNLPDAFCDVIWDGDIVICPSCATTKLFFDFMRRIFPRDNPRRVMSPESVSAIV